MDGQNLVNRYEVQNSRDYVQAKYGLMWMNKKIRGGGILNILREKK